MRLSKVTALTGLSRDDTRKEVWRLLMADYAGRRDEGDLQKLRNEIKDALIIERSEIIPGTRQLSDAAWGRLPMALVTQTTTKDVIDQAKSLGIQLERFKHIECAGDEFYRQITLDKKAIAYTIACRQLDVQPSHAIAFEDSDSGIKSAAAAGLDCVALREPHNRQQLKLARIVVPDLKVLASPEVLALLETPSAQTPIERLCSHFKPR